jgi:hypothetical protein
MSTNPSACRTLDGRGEIKVRYPKKTDKRTDGQPPTGVSSTSPRPVSSLEVESIESVESRESLARHDRFLRRILEALRAMCIEFRWLHDVFLPDTSLSSLIAGNGSDRPDKKHI